jgi:hypothetical protein
MKIFFKEITKISISFKTKKSVNLNFYFLIRYEIICFCRRRIDEMKSTASNTSNRQVRTQTTPMSRVTHPAGSTGHLSNTSAAAAASAEVSLADQEARQALHESKKAIDHLKSVTGIFRYLTTHNKQFTQHTTNKYSKKEKNFLPLSIEIL